MDPARIDFGAPLERRFDLRLDVRHASPVG